jgi:hypothetical protein
MVEIRRDGTRHGGRLPVVVPVVVSTSELIRLVDAGSRFTGDSARVTVRRPPA